MSEEQSPSNSWLGSRIPLAASGRANSIEELSTPAERALAVLDLIINGGQVRNGRQDTGAGMQAEEELLDNFLVMVMTGHRHPLVVDRISIGVR
jgi:hypothetical protein